MKHKDKKDKSTLKGKGKNINRLHLFITNLLLIRYGRRLVIKSEEERLFGKNFKIKNPKDL